MERGLRNVAVSYLLSVPVFCVRVVVFERIQRWQRLAPNNANRILPESELHEMEIYMHHPHDLFDVVMSV